MSLATIGFLVIVLVFVLFFIEVEIGFAMGIAGIVGLAWIKGFDVALSVAAGDVYSVFSSYGFSVICMFVLMGQIGASGGVARKLYESAYKFIGHVPGGLAIGTVAAGTAFKAICGSAPATAATFATIAVPEMDKYNYDKILSCGTVATVGTLGILIPPSTTLIIYGIITETSIGKLFLAGIIPGLIIAFSFVITVIAWTRINPSLAPRGEKSTWKARFASLPPILPVGIIFILVVGGLLMGFFTPTEAGSVGAFSVFLYLMATRDMDFKRLVKAVVESLRIACMVLVLLAGATIMGHFFAVTRTPFIVAEWLDGLNLGPFAVMLIIIGVYTIGGSVIDDLAFLILATPIFFPVAMKLGYDPVWFGIILGVVTMIGIVIPPMAISVFIVSGITKVPINRIYRGIYPYIIGMYICLIILLLFPQLSLWLPNLFIH